MRIGTRLRRRSAALPLLHLALCFGIGLPAAIAQVATAPNIGSASGGGGSRVSVTSPAPAHTPARRRQSSGTAASAGTGLATLSEAQLGPLILQRVPAVYPTFARNMKLTGSVRVTLDLASDGTLMQADAVDGPEMLYAPCIDAIQKWKFAPEMRNGKAVPVRSEVHFVFTDPKKGVSD